MSEIDVVEHIVDRLGSCWVGPKHKDYILLEAAADEIQRLRRENADLRDVIEGAADNLLKAVGRPRDRGDRHD